MQRAPQASILSVYASTASRRFARPGAATVLRPATTLALRLPVALLLAVSLAVTLAFAFPSDSFAQDWGNESDDEWSSSQSSTRSSAASGNSATTPWSLRAGLGFTIDPNTFLMNFEVPYAFDQYVSAGPMIQVGIEDEKLIVAPTANLTISVPDMPGEDFDRFHPMIFVGMGFAVIENDDRQGDHSSAGFLVNTGFGVDFDLSERVAVGSRMILNFLPERTLEQKFWYSWEVVGVKLRF